MRTATVTPAYGMRPVGGFGIRGFRAHCPSCSFLSRTYDNVRGAQWSASNHRCESGAPDQPGTSLRRRPRLTFNTTAPARTPIR